MSGKLAGRGAVVTGAGRGIGKAIVERLTAEGARVAALDMDEDAAKASGAELGLKCDVTDSADVARCIRAARAAFGRLDIAVNNAGTGRAAGDGSDEFYGAMARRNAELAEKGSSDVIVDQLIQFGPRQLGDHMLGAAGVRSNEWEIDFRFLRRREFDFGPFRRFLQSLEGHPVFP